jgi:hypothetical protein
LTNETPANATLARQQGAIDTRLNPDGVVTATLNPFSVESTLARKAKRVAFNARLDIFEDQVKAVRTANHAMNAAAVTEVLVAAETFILEVRSRAEEQRQQILSHSTMRLMTQLKEALEGFDSLRTTLIGDAVVDNIMQRAYDDFARRVLRIAEIDFEFDKSGLLKVQF